MKHTTIILIGVLVFGLAAIVAFALIVLPLYKTGADMSFSERMSCKDIVPVRYVNISMRTGEENSNRGYFWLDSGLKLLPSNSQKSSLSYPEDLEKYLSVEVKGDTLNLLFQFSQSDLPEKYRSKKSLALRDVNLVLTVDSTFSSLYNGVYQFPVRLQGLQADSIQMSASYITVDSCNLSSLTVYNSGGVGLMNSKITDFYLNLDGINNWTVTDCQIDTEHLSSSGNRYCELPKTECKRMIWTPLEKDAQMSLLIKDTTCVSF